MSSFILKSEGNFTIFPLPIVSVEEEDNLLYPPALSCRYHGWINARRGILSVD